MLEKDAIKLLKQIEDKIENEKEKGWAPNSNFVIAAVLLRQSLLNGDYAGDANSMLAQIYTENWVEPKKTVTAKAAKKAKKKRKKA